MSTVEFPIQSDDERVARWRSEVLARAGYGELAAALLARRQDVDLHRAVELAEQGCDEQIALRILL